LENARVKFRYPEGATPIDPNDEADLRLPHITTQAELNEAEFENIVRAQLWSRARKHRDLLTIEFAERLHKRMFGDVWKWAGAVRKIELQNAVFLAPYRVRSELKILFDNTQYRIQNAVAISEKEFDRVAAEFHHRLVTIHYFRNGNGRHAREMTDLLLLQNGHQQFTWGGRSLVEASQTRQNYIEALHEADRGNYEPLTIFARS
jgi:Fic-DOC domain mobile mystery protein B